MRSSCAGVTSIHRRVIGIWRPVPKDFPLTLRMTPACQRLCSERRIWLSLRLARTRASMAGAMVATLGIESLQAGDRFAVYPRCANWQIHHNTIVDCTRPMIVDLINMEGVHLQDNIISPLTGAECGARRLD